MVDKEAKGLKPDEIQKIITGVMEESAVSSDMFESAIEPLNKHILEIRDIVSWGMTGIMPSAKSEAEIEQNEELIKQGEKTHKKDEEQLKKDEEQLKKVEQHHGVMEKFFGWFKGFTIEDKQDRDRAGRFEKKKKSTTLRQSFDKGKDLSDGFKMEMPKVSDLLKLALAGPFVLGLVKGFIEELTDGFIKITRQNFFGALAMLRGKGPIPAIAKMFKWMNTKVIGYFKPLLTWIKKLKLPMPKGLKSIKIPKGLKTTFTTLKNLFTRLGRFAKIPLGWVATLAGTGGKTGLSAITKTFKMLSKLSFLSVLSRFAWPITVFMGLYDSVMAWRNTEGSIMMKALASIGAFLGSIVGAPLDLLKSIVGWVVSKFGFDESAEYLKSINITEFLTKLPTKLWSMVTGMIDTMIGWFTGSEESEKGKATGFFSGIVDTVIETVKGWFKFPAETIAKGLLLFSPLGILTTAIDTITGWFGLKTDFSGFFADLVDKGIAKFKSFFGFGEEKEGKETENLVTKLWNNAVIKFKSFFGFGEEKEGEEKEPLMVRLMNNAIEKIKKLFSLEGMTNPFAGIIDAVIEALISFIPTETARNFVRKGLGIGDSDAGIGDAKADDPYRTETRSAGRISKKIPIHQVDWTSGISLPSDEPSLKLGTSPKKMMADTKRLEKESSVTSVVVSNAGDSIGGSVTNIDKSDNSSVTVITKDSPASALNASVNNRPMGRY
jgi:hypothetical protein